MRLWELLLLAVGLSMDACAVAAANGVCCRGYTPVSYTHLTLPTILLV